MDAVGELGAASAEMVDMCGGYDELASVFKSVSDEAQAAEKAAVDATAAAAVPTDAAAAGDAAAAAAATTTDADADAGGTRAEAAASE